MPGAPQGRTKTTGEVLRKVSCGFKVTRKGKETILSWRVTFAQPFSLLNPLKTISNRAVVHVAFVACLQPHVWLSGADLAFLACLHFLSTPAAGYQKQHVQVGKPPRLLLTVETVVNVSTLACSWTATPTWKITRNHWIFGIRADVDVLPHVGEEHHVSLLFICPDRTADQIWLGKLWSRLRLRQQWSCWILKSHRAQRPDLEAAGSCFRFPAEVNVLECHVKCCLLSPASLLCTAGAACRLE